MTSPLDQASLHGGFELVKLLVEAGAELNTSLAIVGSQNKWKAAFEWALQKNDQGGGHVLRYLLQKGARSARGSQIHANVLQTYQILRQANIEICFQPV